MYKALIADVDGTLVPVTGNGSTIDDATIRTFKAAQGTGCKIGVATGRGWQSTKPVAERLGITDLCIIEGGSYIFDPSTEKVVWERRLSADVSRSVVKVFQEFAKSSELIKSSEISERQSVSMVDPEAYAAPSRVIYLLGTGKEAAINVQRALNQLPNVAANITTPSWAGEDLFDVHVTHIEGTKEQALREWIRLHGLQKSDCIGVGDSENDFPLFEAVGLKIAVGNATDDLKARADVVASHRDEGALRFVIEKFILKLS